MVEQQGRLTLHLHILLWIANSLSPQEMREKLKAGEDAFQTSLVDYLESVHTGDFLTGSMEDVRKKVDADKLPLADRSNPTLLLPKMPPALCKEIVCSGCSQCPSTLDWIQHYKDEVDNLVLRSNVHKCRASMKDLKDGSCAARFPRETYEYTTVDREDGHIFLKKNEPMMNTFSPALTYVMRSNTDVTSLLSGTAIKAVIAYVTDYITKQSLKTHQLFSTAYDVLMKKRDEAVNTN
ncbi:hypothetical protein GALMADRAFT_71973, partial [Galerina marginata CBS 339.88]